MNERDIAEQSFNNGYAKGYADAQPKWISVKDRLPKKDGNYLVAKKSFNNRIQQDVLHFAKDGRKVDQNDFYREWKNVWYYYDSEWGHITIDSVSHWMPLPEAPKGE